MDYGGYKVNSAVGFSIGNAGFVCTGQQSGNTQELWAYLPNTNTWIQKTSLIGVARKFATGFSIGNKAYVGTGSTGIIQLSDFWEYTADSVTSVPEINKSHQDVNVFVNREQGILSVKYTLTKSSKNEFIISDMNGRIILKRNLLSQSGTLDISISSLKTGTYLYFVHNLSNQNFGGKFIVL